MTRRTSLPTLFMLCLASLAHAAAEPPAAPPDVAAPPEDAKREESGLATKVLAPGSGSLHPGPNDSVKVHYSGWTTDGKLFDSSHLRGQPAVFRVGGVIAGWTEALQLMVAGERRRLWIPEELAYKGQPGRPQGMLVFDVELLEVMQAPSAPSPTPPEDAKKSDSGLASKRLQPGSGKRKPAPGDFAEFHYSAWDQTGKLVDSTRMRGEPVIMPLDDMLPGWREGVALMVEGEQRRLWVPANLAFAGRPGAPEGDFVFDLELVRVVTPPATPGDVAAAPADAEKTESGLASKRLAPGSGKTHPADGEQVKVSYTGWTTDGQIFDSTVVRGEPAVLELGRLIAGWQEGLKLMVVGEKRRFWIPEELAYQGAPGAPKGMLVFDVELLEIVK